MIIVDTWQQGILFCECHFSAGRVFYLPKDVDDWRKDCAFLAMEVRTSANVARGSPGSHGFLFLFACYQAPTYSCALQHNSYLQ